MSRSFLKLVAVDLGFQTDRVVTMRASVAGIYDAKRQVLFFNAAVERLRAHVRQRRLQELREYVAPLIQQGLSIVLLLQGIGPRLARQQCHSAVMYRHNDLEFRANHQCQPSSQHRHAITLR